MKNGNESWKFKTPVICLETVWFAAFWRASVRKKIPVYTKLHLSTTIGPICLSTFRPFGGTLQWKMTPVVLACICIVRIIWEVHLIFVYSLNWKHYIINANALNLSPCLCNILVMCLFIWKQIGFVIMETLSIFCCPLCAMMMLSKDLWEVKDQPRNHLFYCPEVPVASHSLACTSKLSSSIMQLSSSIPSS